MLFRCSHRMPVPAYEIASIDPPQSLVSLDQREGKRLRIRIEIETQNNIVVQVAPPSGDVLNRFEDNALEVAGFRGRLLELVQERGYIHCCRNEEKWSRSVVAASQSQKSLSTG